MSKERIEEAFEAVDRAKFMPANVRHLAGYDQAVPIGYGQTISQPYTVGLMLQWLDPQPGNKVLDVGSGSGWTTALLSHLVKPKGKVYAVERIPELVEFGRGNCEKFGVKNAYFSTAGEELGLPEEAPFDRILVSAAADEFPEQLMSQLKISGKLVIPIQSDILEITKTGKKNSRDVRKHPGFVFVPLL
ncbi:MAG TPA: protein-L-isoaspartate O-methyltransferase [Candidatus Saccharimonadales bacterium]|nr:protein-L-isoaspartate O-methyltransferase [Candidatus Saccharimonadales bacterium]